MSKKCGVVMDGRDIGTTVFPDGDVKIFLNASVEERAKRRYEELLKTDNPASFEEVFQNISDRDKMDSTREVSPLKQDRKSTRLNSSHVRISYAVFCLKKKKKKKKKTKKKHKKI